MARACPGACGCCGSGPASGTIGGATLLGEAARRRLSQRADVVPWNTSILGGRHPRTDHASLHRLSDSLAARGTREFLVALGDDLVHERHEPSWRGLIEEPASRPRATASMAKAVVGSTALLLALGDGLLSLDDPAARFIPAGPPTRSARGSR
jgi:hypothetical protein